jgi:hypothetical protein
VQIALVRYGFTVAALVLGSTIAVGAQTATATPAKVVAQATPSPSPTPFNPLTYSGFARAFLFDRQNASGYPKGAGQINQQSFNLGIKLHADYAFEHTPLFVGASYFGAEPFGFNGVCGNPSNYGKGGSCQQYPTSNAEFKQQDTTLPAYTLSTLGEGYLGFKNPYINGKLGWQLFTSPWANPSDSRVKPALFQGVDANAGIGPDFSVGISRMTQWQSRVSSSFNKSNLLPNSLFANGSIKNPTTGFLLAKGTYSHAADFFVNVNYYSFYDVSEMLWLDGRYYPWAHSPFKFYIAGQFGTEGNIGKNTEGTITSQVGGAQLGATFGTIADVTVAFDSIPWRSTDVFAASCSKAQTASGVFLPTGGSPICQGLPGGRFRVFYGGLASPYTDGYATDPLYTTQITQGMVDRRSGGSSFKVAGTFHTADNKLRAILSQAWYDYSNAAGANANTQEFNLDVTYFFGKVGKGPYHGFSVRDRYANRDIRNTVQFGGLPLFVYNRAQLEYDF